jgi:hypothetical protein
MNIHEQAIGLAMAAAVARNDMAAIQRLLRGGLSANEEAQFKRPLEEEAERRAANSKPEGEI